MAIQKATRLTIDEPHSEGQQQILDWQGHGVAFCGRRYGKTQIATIKLVMAVCDNPGLYWWIGLSWRSASMKRAWRLLKQYCVRLWRAIGEKPDEHIRESDKELRFPGGGEIWMRTAERPDSLAGEGIKGVVLDEFSLMVEAVWTEYVSATLLDYGGWALFLGVPKGRGHWSFRLWSTSQNRSGWKAWKFTTYDNPTLNRDAIDELAKGLPERLRRQEIFAEALDDSSAVFRNVMASTTATAQSEAIPGHVYSIGADWARNLDATVFAVVDITLRQLCHLDTMRRIDYETQQNRLQVLNDKFHPSTIISENNSMGGPINERLAAKGLPIVAFKTSNSSKDAIISALVLTFERSAIAILPDETLVEELQAFEQETLPSGLIRYGAPSGMHDDCVMALALAWSVVRDDEQQQQPDNPWDLVGGAVGLSEPSLLQVMRSNHDDSADHRKWSKRNFCPQCAVSSRQLVTDDLLTG